MLFHVPRRAVSLGVSLVLVSALLSVASAQGGSQVAYSTVHRDSSIDLAQTVSGSAKLLARLNAGRSGISVAVTSFHRNATQDLLTGYATSTGGALILQDGAPEALAPTANERPTLIAGKAIVPFREAGRAFELPVRPDLLLAADLRGTGTGDVLTAQRGDSTVYFLAGDGNGGFSTPRPLLLRGAVSAIATWRHPGGDLLLVAAVDGGRGNSGLQFLTLGGVETAFVPTAAAATSIESIYLNNASLHDLVLVAGGQTAVLDGDSILNGTPHLETLGGRNAVAVAAGNFTWDKRGMVQLAVLYADATLRIYARPGLDGSALTPAERLAARKASVTRQARVAVVHRVDTGWDQVELIPGMGAGHDAGALLLHGRLGTGGLEDLLVLTRGQEIQVTHPAVADAATGTRTTSVTVDSTPTPVVAAVAARISADSRLGVITANGHASPAYNIPTTRNTYYVNIASDAYHSPSNCTVSNNATCSLRDAVTAANAARQTGTPATIDRILIDYVGTIALATQNNYTDAQGDVNYHFNLETSVNIVGNAACTLNAAGVATACPTIIDGASKDIIFAINSSSTNAGGSTYNPYSVYLSNLQLQNGVNNNNPGGAANGPYAANNGGLIYDDPDGSGGLFLNSMVLTKGTNTYGYINGAGGCVGLLNGGAGSAVGSLALTNSTVSGCKALLADTDGGGINLPTDVNLTATNDIISSNTVTATGGEGGGITENQSQMAANSTVSNCVFSGNSANFIGGGISYASELTIANSTFTGNAVTGSATGNAGGGVSLSTDDGNVAITYSTFTGNTVASGDSGAGVDLEGTQASGTVYPLSITYSRIHGNTGGIAGTQGLVSGDSAQNGTGRTVLTATNNWWGCNTDPQTAAANCDGAKGFPAEDASFTTVPFTTLALSVSPTGSITAGTAITATGSLGQASNGSQTTFDSYTAAEDGAYNGVPATLTITQGGSPVNSSATTLNTNAEIVTTAAASASGTAAVTVDGFTVSSAFTVVAPDLFVTSTHTGNFKAGDSADTYTLTVSNIGTASTSGTVTLTDTLPTGFTGTAISGTGWTCTLSSLTCTRSDTLAASVSYPAVTLTVSVSSADAGTYTNTVTVAGGGETNTNNDTGTDATLVIAPPAITAAFSPSSAAPGAHVTLTFTITNPNTTTALSGVGLVNSLPANLTGYSTATGTCFNDGGGATGGPSQESLSGVSVPASSSCTFVVYLTVGSVFGTTTDTSNAVTSTNSNAGGTATATLTVAVTPTRLVFTSVPPSPITAGGNAGTVQVALEDGSGNVATNNSSASVSLAVTGPSGYSQTYTGTAANGVATFNLSSVPLTVAGAYTYTASSGSLTAGSTSETVNPGTASALTVVGLSNFTAPQMSGSATVTARDAYGNIATSFTGTVTLTSSDTTATFSPASPYTYLSSDNGVKTFTVTFNTAGTQSVNATSGSVAGSETGIVVQDAIWILNMNDRLVRTTDVGVQTTSAGNTSGTSTLGSIAFDHAGNVWATQYDTSGFAKYSASGTLITSANSIGGLSSPASIFIDGLGQAWFANAGSGSITVLSNAGTAVSPSTGYQPGTTKPVALLIDNSGSVWIADSTANKVVRMIGAAAPVVTPTVTGTTSNTLGTRP